MGVGRDCVADIAVDTVGAHRHIDNGHAAQQVQVLDPLGKGKGNGGYGEEKAKGMGRGTVGTRSRVKSGKKVHEKVVKSRPDSKKWCREVIDIDMIEGTVVAISFNQQRTWSLDPF